MILPIYSYGQNILRQKCHDIEKEYSALNKLVNDMWETMYNANGCGLSAPQIGKTLRLFVVDSVLTFANLDHAGQQKYFEQGDQGFKGTFINAKMLATHKRNGQMKKAV